MIHRSFNFTHALCRAPSQSVTSGLRLTDHGNPDPARLAQQHEAYIQALEMAGVQVNLLPAREDYPDSVFVEDAALVLNGVAILLNPGAESRAGEPAMLKADGAQFFKSVLGPHWAGPVDGGDILVFDDVIFVGLSERTSRTGAESLEAVVRDFGYDLRIVSTPSDILHFKSHSSLLDHKTAIATATLAQTGCFDGFDIVVVPDDEPHGSNVIRVNEHVILAEEAPKTVAMLRAEGFNVLPVPTSEVAKIDGAVSCCSLRYSLS